jgi:RecB family exonuclease
MLGAGRDKINISWQRADDTGRSVSPSPALREVARVALGRPDTKTLLRDAVAHRAVHPEGRLEEIGNATGMLTKPEAYSLTGFSVPEDLPADPILGEALGLSSESLNLLRAIEQFKFGNPAWDGRVGPGFVNLDRTWSATALEMLGRCPLQFFFRKVLGVEELEDEQSPLELAPRDLGIAVHAVLEKSYRDLADEGRFQKGTAAELVTRGLELLVQHWGPAFAKILAKVEPRMEPLYRIRESLWRSAVEAFIRKDLKSLAPLPKREIELEVSAKRTVKLDSELEIRIAGRFDRIIQQPEPGTDIPQRAIITDYKTGGDLKERLNPTYMLKGKRLQVPVYHLLQKPFPIVQLLGIGPNFDPDSEESCPVPFEGFTDDQSRGMIESLSILAQLIQDGVFPLVDDEHQCRYCAFKPACRVNHPPTCEREANATDSTSFRRLKVKTAKEPLLEGSA